MEVLDVVARVAPPVGHDSQHQDDQDDQANDQDDEQFRRESARSDGQSDSVARGRRVLEVSGREQVVRLSVERQVLQASGEADVSRNRIPAEGQAQLLQVGINSAQLQWTVDVEVLAGAGQSCGS